MAKTPKDVMDLAKKAGIKIVDLRFIDLPGVWQHFSIPVDDLRPSYSKMAWVLTVRAFAAIK
jgi:glutamine synthetase